MKAFVYYNGIIEEKEVTETTIEGLTDKYYTFECDYPIKVSESNVFFTKESALVFIESEISYWERKYEEIEQSAEL